MQPLAESSALALLLDLWWRRFPSAVARLSRSLAIALTDGIYLAAWPWAAVIGPSLAFLVGFLLGSVHPSFASTYTYSLPTMALMVAVSGFGSGPGGWLWVGYVLGDSFVGAHAVIYEPSIFYFLFNQRGSLLISYLLLAALVVIIPTLVAAIRLNTLSRIPAGYGRVILELALQAALAGAFVYVWTLATPTLNRPASFWTGTPSGAAFAPLQNTGWVLALLASIVGVGRIFLEHAGRSHPAVGNWAARVRGELLETPPIRDFSRWLRAGLVATVLTLLLAGLITSWLDAAALWAGIFLVSRFGVPFLADLGPWVSLMSHIPVLARLAAGVAISYLVVSLIVAATWESAQTFLPTLVGTVVSALIIVILFPERVPSAGELRASEDDGRWR